MGTKKKKRERIWFNLPTFIMCTQQGTHWSSWDSIRTNTLQNSPIYIIIIILYRCLNAQSDGQVCVRGAQHEQIHFNNVCTWAFYSFIPFSLSLCFPLLNNNCRRVAVSRNRRFSPPDDEWGVFSRELAERRQKSHNCRLVTFAIHNSHVKLHYTSCLVITVVLFLSIAVSRRTRRASPFYDV